jgi:hypothetical protein
VAFDAWMAARSVQTGLGKAVAQFVALGPLGLSRVLLTVKVVAAWTGAPVARRKRTATSRDQRVRRRRVSIVGLTGEAPSASVEVPQRLAIERMAA